MPNISRSKVNQTTKFCQLIEYNMRNIVPGKNSTQDVMEKLVPDPFSKISKFSIYLNQQSVMLDSLFLLYFQVEVYKNILKSDSHLPKKIFFICFNNSPSRMMKKAFYLLLKALFVLKIFNFLSWLFGHVGKTAWLERQG